MPIKFRSFDGRHNVMPKRLTEQGAACNVFEILAPVLDKLLVIKPTWTYKLESQRTVSMDGKEIPVYYQVAMYDGDERLGHIERDYMWSSSKGHMDVIEVRCDRIAEAGHRRQFKRTGDPAKAVAHIKKYFGAKTLTERMDKARELANKHVGEVLWDKERQSRASREVISSAAFDFVMGANNVSFAEYIDTTYDTSSKDRTRMHLRRYEELALEMLTIKKVRDQLVEHRGALVVRDGADYIVKLGEDLLSFTDETLPYDLRGKLGMLKLVEDGQFITDTGCRLTEEIFILIMEEANEQAE